MQAGRTEAAIGDVHGCSDQLRAVVHAIDRLAPGAHLTFLGDLIDRGPDSFGALRFAVGEVIARGQQATLLPGNHEQMLLGALQHPWSNCLATFRVNGGGWLAQHWAGHSPGQDVLPALLGLPGAATLTQDGALLSGQQARRPRLHRRSGNVVFVHAGVDPSVSDIERWIEAADPTDEGYGYHPLWIRDEFLNHKGPLSGGLFVVHGHTPEHLTRRADRTHAAPGDHRHDGWRLGLDGGSYSTGIVSAAILQNGRYRTISARASAGYME